MRFSHLGVAALISDACWLIVGLVWLIGWIYNTAKAPKVERRVGMPGLWLLAVVLWLVLSHVSPLLWNRLLARQAWIRDVGIAFLVVGTVFTLWARLALGTMWSGMAVSRSGHQLRTTGPYAVTRHPIYTGILLMAIGSALANGIGAWALIVVFVWAGLAMKMRTEERLLRETFGTDYDVYSRHVPALVPFLPVKRRTAF